MIGPAKIPALDGVRALSVTLVILAHLPRSDNAVLYQGLWLVNQAARGAYVALDVFFVLSGFFITRLLIDERASTGRISITDFYTRRALRIFPIYYLAVGICWFVFHFSGAELAALFSYTFNYYHPFNPTPNPLEQSWSLSVEEQFYLVWPFLITAIPLRFGSLVTGRIVPLLAIASGAAISIWLWRSDPMLAGNVVYMSLPTRMLSLSLGGWLAFREFEGRPLRGLPCLAMLVGAVVVLAADRLGRDAGIIRSQSAYWTVALASWVMISIAFVATVVFDAGRLGKGLNRLLSIAPLRGVGRISYALYLYHLPVIFWFGLNEAVIHDGRAPFSHILAVVAIVVALATLSWFLIERPLQRLRQRRDRRIAGDAPGVTTAASAAVPDRCGGAVGSDVASGR